MLKTCPNEQLIAHLFDTQLDSVMWFVPVYQHHDCSAIIDFETRYCNQAAADIFALTPEQIKGELLLSSSLVDKEARQRVFEQCLQVLVTGEMLEFTYHSSRLDRYFKVQRTKVREGVLSISRDCSQEIKSELRRKEQEKKFQQLLDASGDGVLLLEAIRDASHEIIDFHIAFCNKWGQKIGRLPSDAVGKSLFEVLPHLKGHEQMELHKQVLDTGEPFQFETTFRTQEGEEYGWFIVSLTKLGDGVISRYTDITQRKQYEEKVKEQKEELRSILDSSINSVIACEAIRTRTGEIEDFLITRVNAAFAAIYRMEAAQIEGQRFLPLFPQTKTAGIFQSYCQVVETGESLRTEMYYEGNEIQGWFDISAVKRGSNGVVISFNDMTPVKKAQLQLEKTVEDLRQSNQSLEEFAFAASHDLQEPLRKIQVFNDRLKLDFAPLVNSQQQMMFERIENAAFRMRMLIDNLMSYSNVQQHRESFGTLEVKEIVQEVLHDLETVIEEKKAQIKVEDLPVIQGSRSQLYQMFQNLVSNSLKYTKPGTDPQITIKSCLVNAEDYAFLDITGIVKKHYYLITLADNGIGFEMKYAQKIFQVFQRLHGNAEFKGTGIGLSIVQKVVQNHNGYIFAESKPGEGATFNILLPVV